VNLSIRPQPQRTQGAQLGYRPEIDGLRAVAVVAVVLYHAQIDWRGFRLLPAGFFGVDIFFVISGYLIGSQVLGDIRASNFSFLRFYERRARRLLPALYLVLLATLALAWFYSVSESLIGVAWSTIATVTFWSNIFFWRQGGYTAEANELLPLLHTWSLSVEEQFYLLFPAIGLIVWRLFPRYLTGLIVVGAGLSLALAELASGYYAAANFYLLPTRVWELLLGVLIADFELRGWRRQTPSWLVTFIGLGAIVFSLVFFNDVARHPGVVTLIPVLGTCLVIWSGHGGAAGWLASRPFVLTGLASYSIYLWHQPIFAFSRIASINALTDAWMIVLIAVSFAAGFATWAFVERPTRNRSLFSSAAIWSLSAVGAAALCGACAILIAGQGFPQRFPTVLESGEPVWEWTVLSQDGHQCHRNDIASGCHFDLGQPGPNWVVVGDSHASVLAPELFERVKSTAGSFHTFTWGGCPVIFDTDYVGPPPQGTMGCRSSNEERRKLLRQMPPSTIVYTARMGAWLEGTRFDNGEGGVESGFMDLLQPTVPWTGERETALESRVTATVEELLSMGHTVIVVYPVPEVGWHVPQTVRKLGTAVNARAWFASGGLTTSYARYVERNRRAFAAFDAVAPNPRLVRVYPHDLLCNQIPGRCRTHDDQFFFYSDDDHLSRKGVEMLVGSILAAIGNSGSQ
jgi:peptidoglycan/LPS O-acetylase OafA/YrhL